MEENNGPAVVLTGAHALSSQTVAHAVAQTESRTRITLYVSSEVAKVGKQKCSISETQKREKRAMRVTQCVCVTQRLCVHVSR